MAGAVVKTKNPYKQNKIPKTIKVRPHLRRRKLPKVKAGGSEK
jgi:hypothetical protein